MQELIALNLLHMLWCFLLSRVSLLSCEVSTQVMIHTRGCSVVFSPVIGPRNWYFSFQPIGALSSWVVSWVPTTSAFLTMQLMWVPCNSHDIKKNAVTSDMVNVWHNKILISLFEVLLLDYNEPRPHSELSRTVVEGNRWRDLSSDC